MSATIQLPVASRQPPAKRRQPANGSHGPALTLSREPSGDARYLMRAAAHRLIGEQFGYREAVEWFRVELLRQALAADQGNKRKAAARLGIAREHVGKYYARGAELVR